MMYIFFFAAAKLLLFSENKENTTSKDDTFPCQGADDSFHFHLEEEGGEAGDVDVRLHADDVDLQVVCL